MKAYRQGDVVLKAISNAPEPTEKDRVDNVLAYGETTGHAHRVVGDAFRYIVEQKAYLRVWGPACIEHEEHESIELPVGDYEVGIQREYDWRQEIVRPVVD